MNPAVYKVKTKNQTNEGQIFMHMYLFDKLKDKSEIFGAI